MAEREFTFFVVAFLIAGTFLYVGGTSFSLESYFRLMVEVALLTIIFNMNRGKRNDIS